MQKCDIFIVYISLEFHRKLRKNDLRVFVRIKFYNIFAEFIDKNNP